MQKKGIIVNGFVMYINWDHARWSVLHAQDVQEIILCFANASGAATCNSA